MFRAIADALGRFCARRAHEDLQRRGLMSQDASAPPALTPEQLDQLSRRMLEAARAVAPQASVAAIQHAHQIITRTYVDTDAEKTALAESEAYRALYCDCLFKAGYSPAHAERHAGAGLDFESQETVDRDHGGAWRRAVA